jgi:long-chain fatty acid transport protein
MKASSMRFFQRVGMIFIPCLLSTQAYAGAVYVPEMADPSAISTGGAGLAAKAQDASTVFSNPAGMTRIKTPEAFGGAAVLYLSAEFDPDGSTTVSGKDGDASMWFGGGNGSYVHPINDEWVVGISAQNYFGLTLAWGDSWVGRYQAREETLIAPQVQPTIAYKVNDMVSIGVGAALTTGYLETKGKINNPGSGDDGRYSFYDSDSAIQGNFGIMIEPSKDTRIGIRYLTETKLEFEDDLKPRGEPPIVGAAIDRLGKLDLDIRMPQSLNISGFHQINDEWAMLGSLGWEDWSRFGEVMAGFDATGKQTIDLKTKDVYHIGIGGQYRWDPTLLLEFGFSYDSELYGSKDRSIILPMGEMYRYGTGFRYDKDKNFTLGGGVDLLWEGDLGVKEASSSAGEVNGEYTDVYFIFASMYGVWRF